MKRSAIVVTVMAVLLGPSAVHAIVLGQLDDFQTGTANWTEGPVSPNQPFQNLNGGPGGVGDHSLRNVSSGVGGAGSKMIMYNNAQWTGDYTAAGVTSISGLMRVDPGSQAGLLMRVAIQGNPGNQYASLNAVAVPDDGAWHPVTFGLGAADLFHLSGLDPLGVVLSNVTELRVLHSTAPNWIGGTIQATLDVDNVTAVPEPTAILLIGLGAFAVARRRRSC